MAIKRYFANKDNTITNAFKNNLITRGTGSNMGASDILETFVIHGETSASISALNAEETRILLEFPISDIVSDISDGTIPSSSVEFRLKMYNAPHANSTPLSYSLDVAMLDRSWTEGSGLDMENYSDYGVSNWINASDGVAWAATGSDYLVGSDYSSSHFFEIGTEDLDLNVDFAVEKWRSSANANYGLLVKFDNAIISGSQGSYYTKRFFGRDSEFYFKRPVLEARWDSSRKDNRGNILLSSSLAPAADNLNSLHLYNKIRGQLKDIPGLAGVAQDVLISFYSGSDGAPLGEKLFVQDSAGSTVSNITGGLLIENGIDRTGIYSASFAITSTFETVHDVWWSGSIQYYTGSFSPTSITASELIYDIEYVSDITNLQSSYLKGQKPRLRVFARQKNWQPNIYNVATSDIIPEIIEDAYYRVYRTIDDMEIIPFGTGSSNKNFTRMSYDLSGNYFEIDTGFFEPGYAYGIQLAYYLDGQYREQPEVFKFRIDKES
jgi:hypothetical protein